MLRPEPVFVDEGRWYSEEEVDGFLGVDVATVGMTMDLQLIKSIRRDGGIPR